MAPATIFHLRVILYFPFDCWEQVAETTGCRDIDSANNDKLDTTEIDNADNKVSNNFFIIYTSKYTPLFRIVGG
jgi:hypothetical protein